ncbi:mucin-5AC-like [Ictalurus punctatus]|uniref:Mucin-5AC-like n=1 Tax=Ictalurus punctatus TaxID=7998 RepID=A0A9F7RIL5_ICTPU|nr:mucin-5AC-like [Ictalurus punctatus]
MSWAMKGLHLIFIALVLWRDTSGFGVWNTTSVVDWQAGRSNATWNQNFHFATPVQALELLSRKSANGNVDGGNSSSFSYTSEVQTAQQDSSFVQSSGGAAQGKPVLNAQGQATPMVQPQDNLMTQSSRLYWFESLKPENCGTLLSQSWPQKGQNNGGFQRPSRFQFGGTANQTSGSQTQSSYQPSTTTQVQSIAQPESFGASASYPSQTSGMYSVVQGPLIASSSQMPGFHIQSSYQPGTTTQVQTGQSASTSQAQSSGASTLYRGISSGRYLTSLGHIIPSSSQSVVNTNQTSGSQTQSSYQPGTTTLLQTGQSASTSQALGSHGAAPSGHAKWYTIVQGQTIPSSQASGSQTQSSYQPGTTTQVQKVQSASTSQAQSSGASTLYPGIRRNVTSLGHGFPYSTQSVVTANQTSGSQTQSSYQPSTTTLLQTGRPVLPQSQPSGASASYPSQTSGVYNIAQRPLTATLSEIPGFHIQSSYQPGTTTLLQTGQSASTSQAQSSGASTLYQGIRRNVTSLGHGFPYSTQSVVTANQTSGSQTQSSYQPGTTTLLQTGQSAPTSQAQSSGASTLYQGIRRNVTSLGHGFPYSTQSVVTANQTSGSQTQSSYQPGTTTLLQTGQSASTSQALGSHGAAPSGHAKWYTIVQGQTIPSSQASGSQTQSSYQPSTTTLLQTGQPVLPQSQPSGASAPYPSQTSGVYNIAQRPLTATLSEIPGFHIQSSYQAGTTTLLQTGQSASTSQAQSSGASTLYQGISSGRYLTSLGHIIPSSSQSVVTTNQTSGSQTQSSYQPGTTTLLQTAQSAPTSQAQSSGASTLYQGIRRNVTSLGHGFPYSTQSVVTANQTSGAQTQSSYQPGTTTLLQTGQSASTSQALGSHGAAPSGHAKWYTIVQGQTIPSSQASGSQTQSSYQPSTTTLLQTGQPVLPQSQPSGASASYPSQTSGVYNIAQRPLTATLSEIPGFHIQSSYQPGTTTLLQTGQSASTSQAQSSGASTLYQGIRRNVTSLGHGFPYSTQSVVTANQTSGSQTQSSYQPSTTTLLQTGQPVLPQSQPSGASASYPSQTSGVYNIAQRPLTATLSEIPGFHIQSSYQPGTTTLLQTGQSASTSQAQSSGASTFYQGISSGRYLTSLGQSIPSSSHSVVTTNKISGLQDQSFQPDTTTNALVGQSASTSLAHGNFQAPNWHTITPPRFHNLLRNVSVSQSLSSDPQTRTINNILPFLNQSAGTSAMSQNNVQTPAFHTSTHFSPVPQTVATPPVSLPKPCRQTQCSMVESAIASIASSQTSPRVATSSQGTGSFAAVPIPGTSQNFAGIDFQGTLPVHDQYSSVCNFPFGFCNSPQGAANNKFVRSQSVQTHNL